MKTTALLGLCALATFASASDVVLETPVTYHPSAGVVDKVKEECKIEEMLASRVAPVLKRRNKGEATVAAGADAGDATVLRLQITHVLGVGGGGWSGPKAITVNAELLERGKVVRQTRINRWSTGGMWGGFKGTCSILDRCAVAIGKDLGRWVGDPAYKIEDEAAPKGAETADAKPEAAQ